MNTGRIVLGVSTALAVVAAAGLIVELSLSGAGGVEAPRAAPVKGPTIAVCGSPSDPAAEPFRSMAASFVIKNTSDSPVILEGLRATTLDGLASARATVSLGAAHDESRGYKSGAAVGIPAADVARSSPVSRAHPITLAPHSYATVITSMTLADGVDAGRASDFELDTKQDGGEVTAQIIRATVSLGVSGDACRVLAAQR